MLDIIRSGGWLMAPILVCSVVALAIALERLWTLQRRRVLPPELVSGVTQLLRAGMLTPERVVELRAASPLGNVLGAGVEAAARVRVPNGLQARSRETIREAMEDAARQVALDLERFLTALGVIASIAPLLGLLGTVIGMIQVFAVLVSAGAGQPEALAGGIGQALITTAGGLTVAIPALIGHRFLQRRVDELLLAMEREAARLLDVLDSVSSAPAP